MNDVIIKNELVDNNVKIENMIYEIRGVQVIYYDIVLPILILINFADLSLELERN